jgi:CheY-like chemotaxis protein
MITELRKDPRDNIELLLLTLGHEVRETLHSVLASVELVVDEPLSRMQSEQLSRLRGCVDQLLRTSNDVAELANPEVTPASVAPCELAEVFDGVMELLTPGAVKRGLDLKCIIDPQTPRHLVTDRRMIEGVLYRVLDDRIKRTERGGITVSVSATVTGPESADIHVGLLDTGPGIASQNAGDLRPLTGSQAEYLGLQVAKKRLAAVRGSLEVAASNAGGTTLSLRIPVTVASRRATSLPEEASADESSNGSRSLRLLVAEDSDESFAVFRTFVREEGHQITRALNGSQAVDMFKTNDYDLVVMDASMPSMDGYTATRLIREWETEQGRARLPIVLLSAEDATRQTRMGAAVGCSGYLTKPTPKIELLRALRHYAGVPSNGAR